MRIPDSFQFSQRSLQDYVDCRRRFLWRYVLGISWPAMTSEPAIENEVLIARGAQFHHYAHQHLIGVPGGLLAKMIKDEKLYSWWNAFLEQAWTLITDTGDRGRHPEINLSAPLREYRLVAKLDLLMVSSKGKITILDWKTTSKRPKREWLKERLQTRVYNYLAARSMKNFIPDAKSLPNMIEMIYWFPEYPNRPEKFEYSSEKYSEDEAYLTDLVDEILRLEESEFFKTEIDARCTFCVYRSLCDRGVKAGDLDRMEDEWEEATDQYVLDFEQIEEIAF